jgi:hypothetical protein
MMTDDEIRKLKKENRDLRKGTYPFDASWN